MEQTFQTYKEKLFREIEEQYGKVVYSYTCHWKNAAFLKQYCSWFKWAQIILSAIATGGFIATIVTDQAKYAWIGGILSTVLLVINGYLKDKDFTAEQKTHRDAANKLWVIREEYIALLTDFDSLAEDRIVARRDDLMKRTSKIYEIAPQTDKRSYTATQRALKNGEEQFFTQKELNILLPLHLRKIVKGQEIGEKKE